MVARFRDKGIFLGIVVLIFAAAALFLTIGTSAQAQSDTQDGYWARPAIANPSGWDCWVWVGEHDLALSAPLCDTDVKRGKND